MPRKPPGNQVEPAAHKKRQRKLPTAAELADRRNELIRLKSEGCTLAQIAQQLGYSGTASVASDLRRALDQRREELNLNLDQYRERQLAGIDLQRQEAMRVLRATHYVVNAGAIVFGLDGQPLVDDAPVLRAIDRLKALDDREARLLGLDAPATLTGTVVTYVIEGVDPADLK